MKMDEDNITIHLKEIGR